jgi:hypothetical protein
MDAIACRRVTPVLVVDAIEPVLPFWRKLGAEVTIEVPHGDVLGFVSLQVGAAEVMYQTAESVRGDFDAAAIARLGVLPRPTSVFVEVDSLADVEARLAGEPVFQPRRTTFYGSRETGFLDPAGNPVLFAQFLPAPG